MQVFPKTKMDLDIADFMVKIFLVKEEVLVTYGRRTEGW